jgi:hypothetical protein
MKNEGLSEEQLSEGVFCCYQLIVLQPFYQHSNSIHLCEDCLELGLYYGAGKQIRLNQSGKFDRDGLVEGVIWC